ncbi:MAG: heavy metal translocating P-type ATPase, partial [Massilibacteroides sp.]|nr:heavy metal translocating P-type ATPase [Massilibacteroides sp.]
LQNESASFNTAALTGESVPRTIRKGEEVLAGMIATDNVSRVIITKPFGQSALARILDLVQNATEKKAPAEQFIRKFARVYTPIVVGLAALIILLPWLYSFISPEFIFTFNDWVYRALVFLVISCPCALVISIPLGYFGGIGAASRHGILFKGSNYLEAITKVNTVVMDKTGTLTQGIFNVQKISTIGDITENELLKIVASVETQSTHPIAKAVVEYANQQKVNLDKTKNVIEIAGHGLEATVASKKVLVGNTKLLTKNQIEFPAEIASIPETIVVCAVNGAYAGYILVADAPKEDAKKAVDSLKELGVKNIVMLSGDKQAIVSKLASELNITQAFGDLLPEGKVEHVEKLKIDPTNNIAFVGDGINDAPVLAMSDVGIAMGGLGSDVAIETADVILQTDQPSRIATAIKIGQFTRRIVIQNISLAFGVKLIVLILGAGGIATLWEAVFADVGVALVAIFNATRILNKKDLLT